MHPYAARLYINKNEMTLFVLHFLLETSIFSFFFFFVIIQDTVARMCNSLLRLFKSVADLKRSREKDTLQVIIGK